MKAWAGLAMILAASAAAAQIVGDDDVPPTNLNIPANLQIFGKVDPNVRKPTAIVNNSVITGTDIDQRLALLRILNNVTIEPQQMDQARLQILQQLIDEVLKLQESASAEVKITPQNVNDAYNRLAGRMGKTPAELTKFLRDGGSSDRAIRRQIESELAWQGYMERRVAPFVNVGEEEVQSIIDGLKAVKGTDEYNLQEIYLSTNGANNQQVEAKMTQIMDALRSGQNSFGNLARTFSEASTRARDGDLGWVRGARLPGELAVAVKDMQPGQVAGPIEIPGGYSLVYLQAKRSVLGGDPLDSRISVKQLSVSFPPGLNPAQANARVGEFVKAIGQLRGCGSVTALAQQLNAEVKENDTQRIRDYPRALQTMLTQTPIGQATPPFGKLDEQVRTLVVCGRDEPPTPDLPSTSQIQGQLQEQRVNLREQQKLRDLRRDAVIDYR